MVKGYHRKKELTFKRFSHQWLTMYQSGFYYLWWFILTWSFTNGCEDNFFLHGYLDDICTWINLKVMKPNHILRKFCFCRDQPNGLRQSPRQWNMRFDDSILGHGFTRSEYSIFVYLKKYEENKYIYLLLYLDDILLASKNKPQIENLKKLLSSEFEMKDLKDAKRILGMEISCDRAR